MPRRNWKTVSPDQILLRIKNAGLCPGTESEQEDPRELEPLDFRLQQLLSMSHNIYRNASNMIYLVMYDIESNKVRTLVAKYLINQGCIRIQNSIFIADSSPEQCKSIQRDLAEVQASYNNRDSIIVVPLSASNVESMHIIGKQLDLDLIMSNTSTLFF